MGITQLAFAAATAIALLCGPASAGTITWNWSYTGIGVNASGTIISDDVLNGFGGYSIQSITGQRNALTPIAMLGTGGVLNFGYGEWNNTIRTDGSLDDEGIAFSIGSINYYVYDAALGYKEFIENGDINGTDVNWAANIQHPDGGAVPEIWTVALLAGGLGAMAFARRAQGGRMVPVSI